MPEETKKAGGLSAEDRRKQLEASLVSALQVIDDLALLAPRPVAYLFGGRKYELFPLSLKKQRLLAALANVSVEKLSDPAELDKALDQVRSTVGQLLGEPDEKFIDEHLSVSEITRLNLTLRRIEEAHSTRLFLMVKKKRDDPAPSDGS
jgi:hypothetical protein